ncbi:MAG TPA: hypothetical protein PLF61_05715, partial [Candidatus Goldiibacteriota bacterium]|nr:hypothetical protein [Candidatus Goldiibacteriota bacterium]
VNKHGDNSPMTLESLIEQTEMQDYKDKLHEILKSMEKAKVVTISGSTIVVSSSANIEKYKHYLEMKKVFDES